MSISNGYLTIPDGTRRDENFPHQGSGGSGVQDDVRYTDPVDPAAAVDLSTGGSLDWPPWFAALVTIEASVFGALERHVSLLPAGVAVYVPLLTLQSLRGGGTICLLCSLFWAFPCPVAKKPASRSLPGWLTSLAFGLCTSLAISGLPCLHIVLRELSFLNAGFGLPFPDPNPGVFWQAVEELLLH